MAQKKQHQRQPRPGAPANQANRSRTSGATRRDAATGPTRRGFTDNILNYARENGIEIAGQEDLDRYFAWYNGLEHAERIELSETGHLASPSVPFDPSVPAAAYGQPDLRAVPTGRAAQPGPPGFGPSEDVFEDMDDEELDEEYLRDWPWFLGDPPEPDEDDETPFDEAQTQAEYEGNEFVRRARVLLDFLRGGRRLTQTHALTRADTNELLTRLGVDSAARSARSMWDVPEIAGTWRALLDGGWIRVAGRRADRGPGLARQTSPAFDPDGFADFAHAVLAQALLSLASLEPGHGGFRAELPDLFRSLLHAFRPGGVTLPEFDAATGRTTAGPPIPVDPTTGLADTVELIRFREVEADLYALANLGVVERDGRNVRVRSAVLQALGVMVDVLTEAETEA